MITTAYGYRNPETGDLAKGSSGWMASYNFNVVRTDAHNHDGVNSAQLTVNSFATLFSQILAADWVASGGAVPWKVVVTVPAAVTDVSNFAVRFVITNGATPGKALYCHWVRTTATTITVYSNDNTIDVLVIYR